MASEICGPPAAELLPRSVAMIMDGNGRWAKKHGWKRIRGHEKGADTVRDITTECSRLGIGQLTLYAFSTENWKRPKAEVEALMRLLRKYLVDEIRTFIDNNIRFSVIGEEWRLPDDVREKIVALREICSRHTGLMLTLALSYGARDEIVRAVRKIARAVGDGTIDPDGISEKTVSENLDTAGRPDPDLILRTAGESRLSNFLLWQGSYAEFIVVKKTWPEFTIDDFHAALHEYAGRTRKFGAVVD